MPAGEGTSTRWLVALGTCVALVAVPLFLWTLLKRAPNGPPAAVRAPEPVVAQAPSPAPREEGLRLVAGKVVDAEGAPVVGASVLLEQAERIRSTSGDDGSYTLEGVPLEPVTLLARAEGYEEWRLELEAGDTGDREVIDILLETARGAEGTVLDAGGEPVARAVVTCTDDGGDPTLASVSDAEGHFLLPSKAVGCEAVARHPDHGDSDPTILRAGEGNELRLREPASIAGYVVDERGGAVDGARVSIESFVPASGADVAGKRGRSVVADDRGAFELGKLQAGTYILTGIVEGRPPARSDKIEVGNGEQVRGVRIELSAGATLTGHVVDAETKDPIAGAKVWLDGLSLTQRIAPTTSDADGGYRIDGVPEGPFSVAVSAEGYVRRVIAGIETRGASAIEQDLELTAQGDGPEVTEYSGIGAMLARPPAGLMIGQIVKGGPSEDAGLKARDRILRIDGQDTADMTVAEAVQLLRGPSGSRVALTVEREGEGQLDLVVTRGTFTR